MRYNIPHISLVLLAILASAAACSSDLDSGLPETATMEEIQFDVAIATRASVTTTSSISGASSPFMVYGEFKTTNSNGVLINGKYFTGIKTIFDATKVTYSSNKWTYTDPKQYWLMGQEYSFVAIHPYPATSEELKNYSFSESDSKVTFKYSLLQNLNDVKDILVAADRRTFLYNNSGAVPSPAVSLKFQHLLSQIEFKVALDEDDNMYKDETDKVNYPYNKDEFIQFNQVDVYGIKDSATYTVAPDETTGSGTQSKCVITQELDGKATNAKLSLTFTNSTIITNFDDEDDKTKRKYYDIIPSKEALLLLPQSFDEDSKAEIVLKYSINGDSNRQKEVHLPLKDKGWEAGKKYTYKFTVADVYSSQVKEGSLKVDIDDFTDKGATDRWISETELLKFEFDAPK